MEWSDEELDTLLRRFYLAAVSGMNTAERLKAVGDFASFIVELVAARSGAMTAEQIDEVASIGLRRGFRPLTVSEVETLLGQIRAQGAALATLRGELQLCQMERDAAETRAIEAESDRATLRTKVEALEKELGEWKRGSEVSFHENKALAAEVERLADRKRTDTAHIEVIEDEKRVLRQERRQQRERADLLQAKLDGLRQAIDDAVKRWGG